VDNTGRVSQNAECGNGLIYNRKGLFVLISIPLILVVAPANKLPRLFTSYCIAPGLPWIRDNHLMACECIRSENSSAAFQSTTHSSNRARNSACIAIHHSRITAVPAPRRGFHSTPRRLGPKGGSIQVLLFLAHSNVKS
jgi:hypothetical protein